MSHRLRILAIGYSDLYIRYIKHSAFAWAVDPAETFAAAGGSVEIEEFFLGCLRFSGQARAMDVGKIIQELLKCAVWVVGLAYLYVCVCVCWWLGKWLKMFHKDPGRVDYEAIEIVCRAVFFSWANLSIDLFCSDVVNLDACSS